MIGHARGVAILAALTASVGLAVDATGHAATTPPHRFPAAGELLRPAVVRAAPDPSARVMRTMRRFRPGPAVPDRPRALGATRSRRRLVVPAEPSRQAERRPRLGQGGRRRCRSGQEPDRRPARRARWLLQRAGVRRWAGSCCVPSRRSGRGRRRPRSVGASTSSRRSSRPIRSSARTRWKPPPSPA